MNKKYKNILLAGIIPLTLLLPVSASAGYIPAVVPLLSKSMGITLLVLEVIAILLALYAIKKTSDKIHSYDKSGEPQKVWWKRMINLLGKDNTEEELKKIDLNHDYDGISELDNPIPAWWNLAWAGTIVFALVYLWRVFVSGTMPHQIEELKEAQRLADIQIEQYLKESGSNVDENTVTMLGPEDIAEGADLFGKNCVACHGTQGEGNAIGPNLTDEYWLHKGGIKDIFYSIKYGWPEQGMKSWKDDFSPVQIAQLASYVKSLQGTNPPNAKEKQGELYVDEE